MIKLEDIVQGRRVRGIAGDQAVTVLATKWHGNFAMTVTYQTDMGGYDSVMLQRDDEAGLSIDRTGSIGFDSDADEFKLASEAYRIHLAHLFDPYLAIRTSQIEPLPHQISAVYQEMLPKLPLRYVLADDPGAGKTVMAGLLIKEMLARSDLKRCLIVPPGNLVEQWQDELWRKFSLKFQIVTNDMLEAAVTRNAFEENDLCIARLDKLARNEDVQALLREVRWDLVVVDEAHKMSATVFGGEAKYTKRYQLGQLLGDTTENLLLMTATPHNGKPEDFQLFMSLVDRDRFEGARHRKASFRSRADAHRQMGMGLPDDPGGSCLPEPELDVSDCMRRLVKEELLKFDGKPLFPERRAYTVTYTLSPAELDLYEDVTEYVTNQFNRAERLDGKRRNSVGFALTVLQRRLASSPEAIYQSLRRRRERLQERLLEVEGRALHTAKYSDLPDLDPDTFDEDDYTVEELEDMEDEVMDTATAAATAEELRAEIVILKGLEKKANDVRLSGEDRKWDELSKILQDDYRIFGPDGRREKLIIFTEHKDTLDYLATKIRSLLGSRDAVITIKGGMGRDERHRAEETFKQDKDVRILVATDAAGEGINLQRAHLMVNYDLPWNPNRIEQRFGRIHRIGQTEVCHLWNLVAKETREGQVFERLFQKLTEERQALGGRVFDVLGRVTFEDRPLRDLLVEAIRYGNDPKVRDRLNQVVDSSLDTGALEELLRQYALTTDVMNEHTVSAIREEMERMEARKLEPHFIESFFLAATKALGGKVRRREPGRWEVTETPYEVRSRETKIGVADPVLRRYERVCFDKDHVSDGSGVQATLVCPGHPLLDATVSAVLEHGMATLKRGTVLVDDDSATDEPRLLAYVESSIQDGVTGEDGKRRTISRSLNFVELDGEGRASSAGYAPYLDYRAPRQDEMARVNEILEDEEWLDPDLTMAENYAVGSLVPEHLAAVRKYRLAQVDKVERAVESRLNAEIQYWDNRAWDLEDKEKAGKKGGSRRMTAAIANRRAEELAERKERRLRQLQLERQIKPAPPRVIGGAVIVPASMLHGVESPTEASEDQGARELIERAGMESVRMIEESLGYEPRDVSMDKCGYDVESRIPEGLRDESGQALRLIEVKGRVAGSTDVYVTKNEILCALNKPESFILAIVMVDGDRTSTTYIKNPFTSAPDFAEAKRDLVIQRLIESGEVILEREQKWR